MTQTLYAHMNKIKILKRHENRQQTMWEEEGDQW
jgi:hypothetical protein